MFKDEKGYTLVEALVVLVVIGAFFYFLIEALDIENLKNRAKNASLQSSLTKIVLSTEGFNNAYKRVPNEAEFLDALTSRSIPLGDVCTVLGFPKYECLFKVTGVELPVSCDLSSWRSDKEGTEQCYIRYYGGPSLSSNRFGSDDGAEHYRIYARMFGTEKAFYIFDSKFGGVLYKCPSTLSDFDDLKECNEL